MTIHLFAGHCFLCFFLCLCLCKAPDHISVSVPLCTKHVFGFEWSLPEPSVCITTKSTDILTSSWTTALQWVETLNAKNLNSCTMAEGSGQEYRCSYNWYSVKAIISVNRLRAVPELLYLLLVLCSRLVFSLLFPRRSAITRAARLFSMYCSPLWLTIQAIHS